MILFTQSMPITISFQILISTASILTFVLLTLFANYGLMKVKWKNLLFQLIGILGLIAAGAIWTAPHLHLKDYYRTIYLDRKISDAIDKPITPQIYFPGEPLPQPPTSKTESVLDRILRSEVVRVGYSNQVIPYAYLNRYKELVGFDIAMAYQLAADLNCRLEFIPADPDHLGDQLDDGIYDIVMSAVIMSEDRIMRMSFTNTYHDQNYVLVDSRKKPVAFSEYRQFEK